MPRTRATPGVGLREDALVPAATALRRVTARGDAQVQRRVTAASERGNRDDRMRGEGHR